MYARLCVRVASVRRRVVLLICCVVCSFGWLVACLSGCVFGCLFVCV